MKKLFPILLLCASLGALAQTCAPPPTGGWATMASAPHVNGNVVELLDLAGAAPRYDLYLWTDMETRFVPRNQPPVVSHTGIFHWSRYGSEHWKKAEHGCLFWRAYTGDPAKYVDPTHGEQDTIAYHCKAQGRAIDPRTGFCRKETAK